MMDVLAGFEPGRGPARAPQRPDARLGASAFGASWAKRCREDARLADHAQAPLSPLAQAVLRRMVALRDVRHRNLHCGVIEECARQGFLNQSFIFYEYAGGS